MMSHDLEGEFSVSLRPVLPAGPSLSSEKDCETSTSRTHPSSNRHEDMPESMPISITVNPVALITTECVTITSAMRKHGRLGQSSVSAILGGGSGRVQEKEHSRPSSRSSLTVERKRIPNIADPGATPLDGGEYTLAGRWGLRGQRGKSQQDNPLMSAFAQLRSDLSGCKDIQSFDAPALLHPFLQVIRSSSTSASITSLAVIAITKFFAYNLITLETPRISLAMQLLSAAITHCRFEASDSSADEIVLLRILKLMESMLSRPEGNVLGDESVCEMMETGLSMCCQSRLSEVLRRSAEIAMTTMCQVIFGRLKTLDVESEAFKQERTVSVSTLQSDGVKMDPSVNGDSVISPRITRPEVEETNGETPENPVKDTQPAPETTTAANTKESEAVDAKPYSLPSIRELFRVLIDLLDPHNRQHTDTMRIMALRIIDVTLEVAGPSIAEHSSLSQLAKDDLCRHLFQLVRSENMSLLNGSLRVAGTLLQTCREVLKLQQELFLSYLVACLHPRVDIPQEPGIDPALYEGIPQAPKLVRPSPSQASSGRSTPVPVKDRQKLGLEGGSRRPEARESMVESIGALVRMPTFMTELFVNYDCEVDRADLCEDMVGLLSRNAFPDSATWSTTNVPPLCLDALLGFVQFMAERLEQPAPPRDRPDLLRLREQRKRKKIIILGATRFNENPKAGIAYLVANNIIDNPDDPLQIAHFLKGTARVSKKVLGDYISKKSNEKILKAFIGFFDFGGKRIDEALRNLLGSFRLPGESQLIERIVTVFTEEYCSISDPMAIADKDAAFVLTYGIIMLNTELYNPNVKKQNRMSCLDFAKNLRGVNAGKDFDPEYLQAIYDSIKQNEIILPDEHDNKHAFDYAWKELLMKTGSVGNLAMCETNAYDADMFAATWKPIVATLCYVFMQASDDAVYSRVVNGFDQCAQIAARYGLVEAFDRIVYSLCTISTLTTDKTTALNTEVQAGNKTVMVSELAVHFGRDFRAQLATVLLFRILHGNETVLRNSWIHTIKIFENLFVNSLIQFPSESTTSIGLPPIALQPPSQIIDRDGRMNDSGLLSAFTSYLSSYAADDPPEPTDEELENTLCTVDCIKACETDEVLHNIFALPAELISPLVNLILSQLPDESSPIVIVKPDRPPPSPQPNGHRPPRTGPAYNPGTVFLLELATNMVLRDKSTVAAAGESLTACLQTLIRDAANLHPLVAIRVVHYLLRLLQASRVSMMPSTDLNLLTSLGTRLYAYASGTARHLQFRRRHNRPYRCVYNHWSFSRRLLGRSLEERACKFPRFLVNPAATSSSQRPSSECF
jgi:golgi-specific brefeldin A-resistance guanine nucleotide exchange factor 1